MPGKPAVIQCAHEDPVALFDPANQPEPSYLSDKYIPFTTFFIGSAGTILHNWSMSRPFFSGIPYILGFSAAGLAVGIWYQRRSDLYCAERDAVYRHYISLHPEDFPAKERILVGDMFKPWVPIR